MQTDNSNIWWEFFSRCLAFGNKTQKEIEGLPSDSLNLFERAFLDEFKSKEGRGLRAIRMLHSMYIDSQRYIVDRAAEQGVQIVTFKGLVPDYEELDALLNSDSYEDGAG